MPHRSHTATPNPGPLFQVRASASDRLPLGARLAVPWPVIVLVLVLATLIGTVARLDSSSLDDHAATAQVSLGPGDAPAH